MVVREHEALRPERVTGDAEHPQVVETVVPWAQGVRVADVGGAAVLAVLVVVLVVVEVPSTPL